MFKQERQYFEIRSVILENGLSKHAQECCGELLSLYITLNQALHLLIKELAHARSIVHEAHVRAPTRKL